MSPKFAGWSSTPSPKPSNDNSATSANASCAPSPLTTATSTPTPADFSSSRPHITPDSEGELNRLGPRIGQQGHVPLENYPAAGVAVDRARMSRSSWNLGGGPTPESCLVVGLG